MDWRIGTYETARPVFDRRRRRFHAIETLVDAAQVRETCVELTLATEGGKTVRGRVTFCDPEVVRLQWAHANVPAGHITEMLDGPPPCLPLRLRETREGITIDAGGTALELDASPWRVRFGPYATEVHDNALIEHVNERSGWAEDGENNDRVQVYETFTLRPGEELFGLGERFLGPGLRGRRVNHLICEPSGTNTTDRVYKSIPLIVSTEGYGLFVHNGEPAVFDVGFTSIASGSVLVDASELDLFVIVGTPKHVLRRYTALTGRPPLPPEWTYGVWMSKCMYGSRAEVEEMLATARDHGIRVDVLGLDPMWLAFQRGRNYDTCDFVWNEEDFGPRDEFIAWLKGQGIRLCLWVNPHVDESSEAYKPERLVDGGRARDPNYPVRGFVDFTGAGGDWWVGEMRALLDAGVDAFKLDYGELAPLEGRYADGRDGRQVHNLYGLLASMTAHRAGAPFLYTRSGTAGSQRYPVHWQGDSQSTWAGMYGSLRGALASAWSGLAFWSSDVGGFYRRDLTKPDIAMERPEPELFIRWTQWGMFASHCRFHGILGREPWLFGDQAVDVTRSFIDLRMRLRPYLQRCAQEANATGCPVMRPVALEFPDDRGARSVDSEFLLGSSLLVVPVLRPGGDVDVYVPPGRWVDYFTGEVFDGPRWVAEQGVPIDRIPLLVRGGDAPFTPA